MFWVKKSLCMRWCCCICMLDVFLHECWCYICRQCDRNSCERSRNPIRRSNRSDLRMPLVWNETVYVSSYQKTEISPIYRLHTLTTIPCLQMSKKRVITELAVQDLNAPRLKGSKRPRATLESDPNIPAEHAQIFQLLSQKKTWRCMHIINPDWVQGNCKLFPWI